MGNDIFPTKERHAAVPFVSPYVADHKDVDSISLRVFDVLASRSSSTRQLSCFVRVITCWIISSRCPSSIESRRSLPNILRHASILLPHRIPPAYRFSDHRRWEAFCCRPPAVSTPLFLSVPLHIQTLLARWRQLPYSSRRINIIVRIRNNVFSTP